MKRTAKDKKRPLLQDANPKEVLQKVKSQRDPLYREIADIRVFVGDNNSRKAVDQILMRLKREGILE